MVGGRVRDSVVVLDNRGEIDGDPWGFYLFEVRREKVYPTVSYCWISGDVSPVERRVVLTGGVYRVTNYVDHSVDM